MMDDCGPLTQAVTATLQQQIPGVVTGYVLIAAAIEADTDERTTHYYTVFPDEQPLHVNYGLLQIAGDLAGGRRR